MDYAIGTTFTTRATERSDMGMERNEIPTVYDLLCTLKSDSSLEEEWFGFGEIKEMSLSDASVELAELTSYVKNINNFFSEEEIKLLPYLEVV